MEETAPFRYTKEGAMHRKLAVTVVLCLAVVALMGVAVTPAVASGQAYSVHEWNAVWYLPTVTSEDPLIFTLQVKMDDPLGTGKVVYDAVITWIGEYPDPNTGYYHVYFKYDFYKDGILAWRCYVADHYIKDLNARLPQRFAAPEVAYGQNEYAGWEAHLISGFSGGGTYIWAMKGYFVQE